MLLRHPSISVTPSNYHGGRFLAQAFESIQKQTSGYFELLFTHNRGALATEWNCWRKKQAGYLIAKHDRSALEALKE